MHQVIDEFHLLEEVLSWIVSASADLLHSGLVASTAAAQLHPETPLALVILFPPDYEVTAFFSGFQGSC